jgi:hypothetical protein
MSDPLTTPTPARSRRFWFVCSVSWRQGTAALLTAGALATAWASQAPTPLLALLGGLLLVLLGGMLWPWGRVRLVGPLFVYDLARLARRGRTTLLRATYGLLLLAWLCFLFGQRFPEDVQPTRLFARGPILSVQEWVHFTWGFVAAVMLVQGAAVFVITPAYLAGAITEEKERQTLELLFTTPLLDCEIILGKLLGRLVHLATVLLTGSMARRCWPASW